MTPHEPATSDPLRPLAAPHVITSEPSGRWTVTIRRELAGAAAVEETRSLAECWQRLATAPESFAIVEVTTGNLDAFMARMARREAEFPRARIAVVADRCLSGYEWLVREAGAVAFVTSPRRLGSLATMVLRHLDNQPPRPADVIEQIWAGLPWSQHATRPQSAVES